MKGESLLKINFNKWFYEYHHYLKNSRNGIEDFNDTKWNNMNERLSRLIDLESDILAEQPFGVISNKYGFDKLIELFEKSNYIFRDLDNALVDTYKMSYENAMSRMMVNTHAVIAHYKSTDKYHVSTDPLNSKYYIVDVPFDQLHFGDRDEFIRQYLNKMYNHRTEYYMPVEELISSDITKVLNCTFICVTNGMFCNDWSVAMNDQGFSFRIGWGREYDADFIIYKLDEAIVNTFNFPTSDVFTGFIPKSYFKDYSIFPVGVNCIVNFYIPTRMYSNPTVPNFGVFKEDGLHINYLQQKSISDIKSIKNVDGRPYSECRVIVYGLKYLHELPNAYPCVNFMDMLYSHPIMTEDELDVYTYDEKKVIGMAYDVNDTIPPCTPPISVDRSASTSFKNVLDCLQLKTDMLMIEQDILKLGISINNTESYNFENKILNPAKELLEKIKEFYKVYMIGGIITSLVTFTNQSVFRDFINRFESFINKIEDTPTINTARQYSLDEFYGVAYSNFVERVTRPFNHPSLVTFRTLNKNEFTRNYFDPEDKNTRFTRPISEQCFIVLKYSSDDGCWLFTYPEIKHFHGIGNTFYIDSGLKGNEVFKFLFLYTDTEDPMVKNVEEFSFEDVFDFDKFSEEVDKYQAYIRYWNVENHLRKITKILFTDDSTDNQLQVLSKILSGKLNGEELLDLYPTDMNYEPSNASSDNVSVYTENSERAPFALNFLFYTIAMMYDNKDQLLSYFIRSIVKDKYTNRYSDIDISSVLKDDTFPVNYSIPTIGPHGGSIHGTFSGVELFYGIPHVFGTSISSPYDYVFNKYDASFKFPLIDTNNTLNYDVYLDNHSSITKLDYSYDIKLIKKVIGYLDYCFDFVNLVETRFTYSFNIYHTLWTCIKKLVKYSTDISDFIEDNRSRFINTSTWLANFTNSPIEAIGTLGDLASGMNSFTFNVFPNHKSMYDYLNIQFLKEFHRVYKSYGFEDFAVKRIDAFYYHMIKINQPMNLFEFEKWINDIDLKLLMYLKDLFANNPNNNPKPSLAFADFYNCIEFFVNSSFAFIDEIRQWYNAISTSFFSDVRTIENACFTNILPKDSYELYAVDKFDIHVTSTYATQPRFIAATISFTNHVGNTQSKPIILIPITEYTGSGYRIKDIRQLCSYAFISTDGSSITPTDVKAYDNSGNIISPDNPLIFDIVLTRVSNASDIMNDMEEMCDVTNTELPFKNAHESSVAVGNMVKTVKHANLNFELLSGNRFVPLESTHQYTFTRGSLQADAVDVVNASHGLINSLAKMNLGNHRKPEVYVKPVQVLHNDVVSGKLKSTGQGYYKNHKIYLKTCDDHQFVFPIIVRGIDHSEYQGFVEAIVDYNDSKWFKLTDSSDYSTYISSQVECEVIDDNVCNFLDEFNNQEYESYQVIPFRNNINEDIYSLPGDPLYVQENSDYVHTRLDWIFGTDIPNRFIDQEHKSYRFVYINSGAINENDSMRIFMLNHNFNTMTLPEMYPTLRDEPNEHMVRAMEKSTFETELKTKQERLNLLNEALVITQTAYAEATDPNRRFELKLRIEDITVKIEYFETFIKRLEDYINQPESPTTWYNLYAYDDAITYINNGRATMTHIPRVRDLTYTDRIEVQLYDWEHKCWLNPSDFTITVDTIDGSRLDNYDDYKTDDVQYSMTITPIDLTFSSKKVLVYFVYNTSDIYEDVETDKTTVNVRFKPVLSTFESNIDSIYDDIKIRKHYDSNEAYKITETYLNEDFSLMNGLYVKRIRRSGKYTDASICRWDDLKVVSNSSEYNYSQFDIYVRFPFNNINQSQYIKSTSYSTTVNQSIDGFEDNEKITLVCVSETFNGNVSQILFTATTSTVNDEQTITITDTSLHSLDDGTYVCTVAKDPMYKSCGGLITVTVETIDTNNIIDANHRWIKVQNAQYKIIPDEFIIVPSGITPTLPMTIELHNVYEKDVSSTLTPKIYYYDKSNRVRYPISNITHNDYSSRLNIDMSTNTNVKMIKSNYIGICRYSTQKIPNNGLMDFTGYIPTPLSRDRYEFWVNGRCLKDVNIISPTSIQLCNLTSLRNFELIELVDDIDNSNSVFPTGHVYMDLEGNTFSSYTLMMMSNANIRYQNIKYRFYFNTKSKLDNYTKNIISDPNNCDVEIDIMSYLTLNDLINSYNELYNIPSINGVPIYHPTTIDLGLLELPHDKIIAVYDKVWAKEISMNPLFPMTHRDLLSDGEYVKIHEFPETNSFRIVTSGICDKFFTLYITSNSTGSIVNVNGTKKIIPMIKVGTTIIVDESYRGYWVRSTFPNTQSVQLK